MDPGNRWQIKSWYPRMKAVCPSETKGNISHDPLGVYFGAFTHHVMPQAIRVDCAFTAHRSVGAAE